LAARLATGELPTRLAPTAGLPTPPLLRAFPGRCTICVAHRPAALTHRLPFFLGKASRTAGLGPRTLSGLALIFGHAFEPPVAPGLALLFGHGPLCLRPAEAGPLRRRIGIALGVLRAHTTGDQQGHRRQGQNLSGFQHRIAPQSWDGDQGY